MRVYEGSEAIAGATRGCVLTIGNFDGLHLGHQELLREVVATARERESLAAVYTFDPHPRSVLAPGEPLARITSRGQFEQGLRALGLDVLIREPFTRELAALAPEAFVEKLLGGRVEPSLLLVGRDFRFGRGRSGSDAMLEKLGPRFGFDVRIIGQVLAEGSDVSSTRVRQLIEEGQVEEVNALLGRPYAIWGRVVPGDGRGRTIGFPTANLSTENDLVPARGVYATTVRLFDGDALGEESLRSVTNVGLRPTFGGTDLRIETHLFDFAGDLVGRRLALHFHARIRDERRFSGPDELRAQIARDCDAARDLLSAE